MAEFDHHRVVVRMRGGKFVVDDARVGYFTHHGLRGVDEVDPPLIRRRFAVVGGGNGVEERLWRSRRASQLAALEYDRMRLEIDVRGHRVGILGRIGVEVARHQPQRFHRIAADGAVEDAVDLPVAVGVARPGCALPRWDRFRRDRGAAPRR